MDAEPVAAVIDGRYAPGPVIGRGAMGEVRRGRDLRLERDVAIKYLRADLAADAEVRARFADEARAAARLSHPSIVAVFDSGDDGGIPYLVMECLPGRTLADECALGPMTPERAREIAVDVAGALSAAHQRGVIHRDVKPGNILLTETGKAKLADFGIAKSTQSLDHTATGMIIGTPAYLAPERLAGEPATARSDVYSLGVVLYEALTGEKPFRGDTPIALAHAIHTTTPPPIAQRRPGVDAALAGAIDRAMAKDPADRPPSAEAFAAHLAPATGPASVPTQPIHSVADLDRTAPATPTPTPTPTEAFAAGEVSPHASRPGTGPRRWWRRRHRSERRVAATIAAAVVAVVALLVVMATTRSGGDTSSPPPSVAPTTLVILPEPLDDAIGRLEESVQP